MTMKLVKVTFEYLTEDGRTLVRTLEEGEEVARFEEFNQRVCLLAHMHGDNPPWETLRWVERVGDEEA